MKPGIDGTSAPDTAGPERPQAIAAAGGACRPRPNLLLGLLAAGLALATLSMVGCAGMLSLSNDQVLSMIPGHVKRMKLNDLSPKVALYLRTTYGVESGDAYVTIVDDLLLRDLFAKARVLRSAAASFWDVRGVADSDLPSLTREIVYGLSHGEDSLLLVSASFAESLGKREELILVHESAHRHQHEQEQYVRKGASRIVEKTPSMDDYLADPRERDAYKWEIRYAQTVLGMSFASYLNVRIGFVVEQNFSEAMAKLWREVEQERAARNPSSALETGLWQIAADV